MRRAYRQSGWLWAGALALWLGACSSSDHEDGSGRGGWWNGGQTGSLTPACGVTPGAMQRGVPASAAGIVVESSGCGDGRLLDPLTVRDASGRAIPFELEQLPNGELLIVPAGGLMPGSYTVSVMPRGGDDEDGGVGVGEPAIIDQTVDVRPSTPLPDVFGELARSSDYCDTVIELTPYEPVLPYLGLISVDIQIDDGPVLPLIATGTMRLEYGAARVALPLATLEGLADGAHQLRVIVSLAGESMPLDVFMLTIEVPCYLGPGDEAEAGCAASGARHAAPGASALGMALAAALFALRKRRRRAR